MAPKQRTWNYGSFPKKKKKKKPIPVSKENIQMASGEYLMHSPLNYMAKIGADYGTDVPRIVQSPKYDPRFLGVYYPEGFSTNRLNQTDAEYFRKVKNLPKEVITDTESMSGKGDQAIQTYRSNLASGPDKKTYGAKSEWWQEKKRYKQGTGYQATSRPRGDVIGLDPRNPSSRDLIGYQPRDYGGLRSYESEFMEGRGYLGDDKEIYDKPQQEYRSAISQLDTLDHELQHRGFARWREIVKQDRTLRDKLLEKYKGNDLILSTFLFNDHPYIYSQTTMPEFKKRAAGFTRQMKEMVDQEILPYFFKRIPSLKKASSLQGPAYGDVKGRGTTMKKRKYQTKKKRGTASYAVKTRGKYMDDTKSYRSRDRVYKGSWNY